jgi:asparagine synthase (glutamine-hydrolysing)
VQPITNADESLAITVNGEFYGYQPMMRRLREAGYAFKTESDSEVALHLYHQIGTASLAELRGEFAFALWDERNRLLFAAVDRYGICPIVYSMHRGTLYLASEAKALFAAGVPAVWDEESVHLQHYGVMLPDRTLFAGVRKLPAGCFLTASSAGVRIERYWDIEYPCITEAPVSAGADWSRHVGQVRQMLEEAVRVRMPGAQVKYGCYLSSGIDSSATLGIVARHSVAPVPAFTICFDDPTYDETPVARRTAAQLGVELHELHVDQEAIAVNFGDTVYHCESPIGNGGSVAKFLLSRLARSSGLHVVLSGEGADEIFAGYEEMAPAPHADGEMVQIAKRVLGEVPVWMVASTGMGVAHADMLSADFRRRMEGIDPIHLLLCHTDVNRQLLGRHPIDQSLYLWARTVLANFLLRTLGDGVERANSIEARLPMLDHKLAELVRSLPLDHRYDPNANKRLLREASRPFVTDEVYTGPKRPFLAPPASLDPANPFYSMLQDLVHSRHMQALPFADTGSVADLLVRLVHMPMRERLSAERMVLKFASACILQERFALSSGRG